MAHRRSATQQVASNNPDKKHVPTGRGVNDYFRAGAQTHIDSKGAPVTMSIPVGRRPAKNKATK